MTEKDDSENIKESKDQMWELTSRCKDSGKMSGSWLDPLEAGRKMLNTTRYT